ncbi:MAG: elongation factor P [Candidatus Levybacteria bacterium RIFCSPLOWO2_12_FULL_37_14]|uniref:Elongation factor P n=1 Tax=Candidatus Zambryskibacteria bacterium RIFCSPHIGHO2_02_38_10.5 TaxID=1802742 RepID=A0A1G2T827_9BACT|nr:MAG: Elongation factor P [Candidatus Levybacteria bacterium GW2011_GWA1_37_16]KKQ42490.1 MAG: Elongation factor P [Candidatus Levybacteria bacterium GW2011_GWB1_37_8]OGH50137.1 MAG: elongation factor P [Candidatus Levybacteria bacterium RIFCSPLOWO2_12_FULL_37_14]OHA93410.1 MAG: elongation factor P [Candidatus Zambryskibacteria bacterium RIFCSPHIGHO2_02_38_10.5]
MIPVTSLRPGVTFEEHGDIFEVLTYNNMHLRKTSSVVQVKVRSLRRGGTTEKTFGSNGEVNPVRIEKKILQFLYRDPQSCYFMDPQTFEQINVPSKNLHGVNYLKDGEKAAISFYKDEAISLVIPPKVKLKVTDTNPGVKGNSATSVHKDATLENGLTTKVPLFINIGDEIIVDTRNGSYTNRA